MSRLRSLRLRTLRWLGVGVALACSSSALAQVDEFQPNVDAGAVAGLGVEEEGQAGQRGVDPEAARQQFEQKVEQAISLYRGGDLDGAMDLALELIEIDGTDMRPYLLQGKILRDQGFFAQSLSVLSNVISAPAAEPVYELGRTQMELKDYKKAIKSFSQAAQFDAMNPEIAYYLGLAQAKFAYSQAGLGGGVASEDLASAIASFDLAIKIRPDYGDALFERGAAQLQLGETDLAVADLRKATSLEKPNPEAFAQLGYAYSQRARTEANRRRGRTADIIQDDTAAIEAFGKFLELVPPETFDDKAKENLGKIRPLDVLTARATAHIALGDELTAPANHDSYRAAIADTLRIEEIEPSTAAAYFFRGVAHRMLGDFDAAIEDLSEGLRWGPTDSEPYLRRGIIYFRRGEFELAKQDFTSALRYQIDPRAMFWLGLSHAKLGNYAEATRSYSDAIRYGGGVYPAAVLNRGLALMRLGRFEKALDDFNSVLRTDKENALARSMRDRAQSLVNQSKYNSNNYAGLP